MNAFNGVPYAGPVQISLDNCKEQLIDLPNEVVRYLRSVKPGIEMVAQELAASVPVHGADAGVTSAMHQRFVADGETLDKLREHEATLAKALEVVRETIAKKEHDRENTVSHIVDVVKSAAQRTGNPSILAPFQKTIEYSSQYAMKAAETRRKNAKAKEPMQ